MHVYSIGEAGMTTAERRADLRGAREERLFVRVLSSTASSDLESIIFSGSTEDVSASGLSLVASENLPRDSELELWVEIKGCPGKFLLTGVVRWCQPRGSEFCCGVEFIEADETDFLEWQDLFI